MIPYLVIGAAALVGLFGWGLKGLILGASGGLVFSLLFGTVLTLFSGGLLPRKVRKEAARRFIALHPDLAQSVFLEASQPATQRSVERCIEAIFKRATAGNKSMNLEAGWDRAAIQVAAAALIAEEPRPAMQAFLAALEQHIEREMYS